MRIKDVVEVGHLLGRERRTCSNEEIDGVVACIGAVGAHLAYVYSVEHLRAFSEAVKEAAEGRWS